VSHWTTVQIELRDEAAIIAACKARGWTVERNAEAYGFDWGPNDRRGHMHAHGELVIRAPGGGQTAHRYNGAYDLALNRDPKTGRYVVTYDTFIADTHLAPFGGETLGLLKQEYGLQLAERQARARGYRVSRQTLPNGSVRLTLAN
jgi:hypothetical protein